MADTTILTTDPALAREGAALVGEAAIGFHPLPLTDPLHPALHEGARAWAFVDWLLPRMSGLEMCRRLCAASNPPLRVVMVLNGDDLEDRRRALAAGADDYVTAPIGVRQMIERVRSFNRSAQLSRLAAHTSHIIVHGELAIDLEARLARWRGRPIRLQPRQFRLLHHFLLHPNTVCSRADLVGAAGREGAPVADRTVDKWVARLRTALGEVGAGNLLRTVHFEGYVLDLEDPQ